MASATTTTAGRSSGERIFVVRRPFGVVEKKAFCWGNQSPEWGVMDAAKAVSWVSCRNIWSAMIDVGEYDGRIWANQAFLGGPSCVRHVVRTRGSLLCERTDRASSAAHFVAHILSQVWHSCRVSFVRQFSATLQPASTEQADTTFVLLLLAKGSCPLTTPRAISPTVAASPTAATARRLTYQIPAHGCLPSVQPHE